MWYGHINWLIWHSCVHYHSWPPSLPVARQSWTSWAKESLLMEIIDTYKWGWGSLTNHFVNVGYWQKIMMETIGNRWRWRLSVTNYVGDEDYWWQIMLEMKIFGDKWCWRWRLLVTNNVGDEDYWWQIMLEMNANLFVRQNQVTAASPLFPLFSEEDQRRNFSSSSST